MTRGTTPTHTFTLPDDLKTETLSALYITYAQRGKTVLEKALSDVTINNGVIACALTQAETLLFSVQNHARSMDDVAIQVRMKTSDGTAMASDIMCIPVMDVLKDGEI